MNISKKCRDWKVGEKLTHVELAGPQLTDTLFEAVERDLAAQGYEPILITVSVSVVADVIVKGGDDVTCKGPGGKGKGKK